MYITVRNASIIGAGGVPTGRNRLRINAVRIVSTTNRSDDAAPARRESGDIPVLLC
jgi:hypothetical protein